MQISSVQATVHSLFPDGLAGEPPHPTDRSRHIRAAIDKFSPYLPQGTPFVVITGAAPGGNSQHVYDVALREFAELAKVVDAAGMRLAFEPLNPILFNSDTALWTLGDALELVRSVDHPAFGLCVDAWNIWQTPEVPNIIRQAGDRIFLMQVSDWRRPRSHNDRISVGDGSIPLAQIVAASREAGYNGPYVLEIFSSESLTDSIWRQNPVDVVRKNKEAFSQVWKRSFSA